MEHVPPPPNPAPIGKDSRRVLFLLTADYPFGGMETYLEGEMPFLARRFGRVLIWSGAEDRGEARPVPENVVVLGPVDGGSRRLPAVKWARLLGVLLSELWTVAVRYRLVPGRSLVLGAWRFLGDGIRLALEMQAEIARRGIDPRDVVVYSYWAMESAMACAVLKSLEPGVAAVTRAHGYDVYFERHRLPYLPFRGYLVRTLDAFYAVSGHGAAFTAARIGSALAPAIQVRYLGAAGPRNLPPAPAGPRPIVFLTCASLIPLKRIGLFIDALAAALAGFDAAPVQWQHFGGGPLEEAVAAQAARVLGPLPTVTCHLAGAVPHAEVLDFLATHHVDWFVSASQWEGLPVSMMEAMAHGIPVVATDVGGCSEIVRDGRNGFLVGRDPTPAELGQALRTALELPPDAQARLRQAARATWQESFDQDRNYADFAAELASLRS